MSYPDDDDNGAGWRLVNGEWRLFSAKPFTWVDADAEHDRRMERIEARVKLSLDAERRAVMERHRLADEASEANAVRLMQSWRPDERVQGYRRYVDIIDRRHHTHSEFRLVMPAGVGGGFAKVRARTTVTRPIVDEATFAVWLHEKGHCLAGECPRTEPHRPDPSADPGWFACLACETTAWDVGMRLAPLVTRDMWSQLRHGLLSYRGTTPGGSAALSTLDHLVSSAGYATAKQAALKRSMLQDKRQLVNRWLSEAGR